MIRKIGVLVALMVGATMAQTGGISGQVTDALNGNGLPGAIVRVYQLSGHHPRPIAWTTTLNDGSYEIMGMPDGAYFVKAHKWGYLDRFYQNGTSYDDADTVYVTDGQVVTDINIALPPRDSGSTGRAAIMGYVYDEVTGQPIQGALVIGRLRRSTEHGRRHFTRAFTDENGFYTLAADSGSYVVSAFYWGYVPEWYDNVSRPDSATPIAVNPGDTVSGINFTLMPFNAVYATATIQGTVVDSTTGEPIAGAIVRAIPHDTTGSRHGRRGHWYRRHGGMFDITDSTGAYSMDVVAPSEYLLLARAPFYYREFYDNARNRSDATPVQVDSGDVMNIDFDLVPWMNYGTATVSGTVIDENTGEPISNAVVIAFMPGDSTHHRRRISVALTDSLGNYTLQYLPEGQPVILFGKAYGYRGEFYDDAYTPDSATPVIPTADNITIDLVPRDSTMGSGGVCGYTFADGNQPFAYGLVFARDINTGAVYIDVSDEAGIYSVDNLPPGDYELYATDFTGNAKYIVVDTVEVLDSYVDQDIVVSPSDVAEPVVPSLVGPALSINRISGNQFAISFSLEDAHNVSLRLYDATGRLVKDIFSGRLANGTYSFTAEVNRSSVYFVRLALDNGATTVKKVIALR